MVCYIDLFAGCGGFSAGLRAAGLESRAEIEIDHWASETLRENFRSSEVIESDIREISDDVIRRFVGVDVIVGGPPCQGFSVAGTTQFGVADPRNELVFWFLHWVAVVRPKIAIIENVPNILTKMTKMGTVLDVVRAELEPLKYTIDAKVLNSADYGVPQQRKRAFIVCTAPGVTFEFPLPTHSPDNSRVPDVFRTTKPYVTVGEAFSDLPIIDAGQGTDGASSYFSEPQSDYQREMRSESRVVLNHIAMKHTDRLIERFKKIEPGKSLKDVALEYGQVGYRSGEKSKKPFKYNNYRLDPAKPSLAIPASFQSLFLHPSRHRNLTAREAARLMSFPDTFVFRGKRTAMSWEKNLSQYNQIGNSVCPLVSKALGTEILRALRGAVVPTSFYSRIVNTVASEIKRKVPHVVPSVICTLPQEVKLRLKNLANRWLGVETDEVMNNGTIIPLEAIALVPIVMNLDKCPVCSADLAPNGKHSGAMPLLISKDDIQSLVQNENDHGLDYHLRVLLGIENHLAVAVAEKLIEEGLAADVMTINPRTGRRVRGIELTRELEFEEGEFAYFEASIEKCFGSVHKVEVAAE